MVCRMSINRASSTSLMIARSVAPYPRATKPSQVCEQVPQSGSPFRSSLSLNLFPIKCSPGTQGCEHRPCCGVSVDKARYLRDGYMIWTPFRRPTTRLPLMPQPFPDQPRPSSGRTDRSVRLPAPTTSRSCRWRFALPTARGRAWRRTRSLVFGGG